MNASRRIKIATYGLENVVREHALIVNAIELQDPDASAKAMESHQSATSDRFLKGITKVGASRYFNKRVSRKIKKSVEKGGEISRSSFRIP